MARKTFTTIALLSSLQTTSAFVQCYFPDGQLATDYTWVACYTPDTSSTSSSVHAPCCIPSEGDVCQDNGLCFYPGSSIDRLFRGACTDPTFQDPACPQICTNTQARNETWVWTEKCEGADDNWQCGGLEDDGHQWAACNDPDELFAENVLTTRTVPMSAPTTFPPKSVSSTSTPVTPGSTPDPTPPCAPGSLECGGEGVDQPKPEPEPSDGGSKLSTGAIAGIAVGGAAIVLFLVMGSMFFFRRRSMGTAPSHQPSHTGIETGDVSQYPPPAGFGQTGQHSQYGHAGGYMATHTVENPYPYPNPSQAANSRGGAAFGATAVNELDGNGGDNKGGYYTVTHEIGGKTVVPDGLSGAAVEQRNVGGGVVQSQPSPPVEMPASEVQRYA